MLDRLRVDIVVIGDASEGYALRGVLEFWGFWVDIFPIGHPRHLVEVLSQGLSSAPYLLICCHGVEDGIVLPALHPDVAKDEPFLDLLTPEILATFARLPSRTVVSTGCSTGSEGFARAFIQAGCAAYIAPAGDPEASSAMFFALHLFYDLVRRCPLGEAFEKARSHDDQTEMFRLFVG